MEPSHPKGQHPHQEELFELSDNMASLGSQLQELAMLLQGVHARLLALQRGINSGERRDDEPEA